ncbi:MAG: RNA 2',3'-cyclic phosphodiesterase [Candidatus Acidiferrales bacterium]
MRLFVALEIPAAVRDNLATLIKELRNSEPKARWVRPESLHVTLKFLGETPSEKLEAIRNALSAVRWEQAVRLDFRGLGFFPNEKCPRVLWAGMDASPNVQSLAASIDEALEKLGFPREDRDFAPHLTIARFLSPQISEKLRAAIQQNMDRESGCLRTNEFHLIESKLKPSGAEYTRLATFSFAAVEN